MFFFNNSPINRNTLQITTYTIIWYKKKFQTDYILKQRISTNIVLHCSRDVSYQKKKKKKKKKKKTIFNKKKN